MKTIAVVTVIVAAMANISAHAQPVAPGSHADQANMCWHITDSTRNYGSWALCDDRAQHKKGKKKVLITTVYTVIDDTAGGGFNGGGGGGGGGGGR
jgi:hypothetical protein